MKFPPDSPRRPVFLVDAMNYIFRAYYGVPGTVTAPSGMKINAILGYLRTMLRLIREQEPLFLATAFEGAHSFRRTLYAGYKANRARPPEDLTVQFDYCKRLTEAIGIPAFQRDTFEADDIIGSIAVRMARSGHPVVIVSGDKDLAQLVDDRIHLYDLAKNVWLDANAVKAKLGVRPPQVPDLLALLGDAVDNIPGIQGVGGKTATLLLSRCESIEDIPNTKFDDVPIRGREQVLRKIHENMELARTSRELARIRCDVDLGLEASGLRYRRGHPDTVIGLCKELGLHGILNEIPLRYDQPGLFD